MSRRVGFGGGGGEGDGGVRSSNLPARDERRPTLIPAIFLTVWLVLWAFGMFVVAAALVGPAGAESGVASFAMAVWLVLAGFGWLLGLRSLRRILRGEPAFKRRSGSGGGRRRRDLARSDPSDPDAG